MATKKTTLKKIADLVGKLGEKVGFLVGRIDKNSKNRGNEGKDKGTKKGKKGHE